MVVADGVTPTDDPKLAVLLQEAYRHCKPFGAWGSGTEVLELAGIRPDDTGVVVGRTVARSFVDGLTTVIGLHRVWDRAGLAPASDRAPAR